MNILDVLVAVLVLGGGSNVLIGDEGFSGTVVRVATRGVDADVSSCSGATVRVAAGEDWECGRRDWQHWVVLLRQTRPLTTGILVHCWLRCANQRHISTYRELDASQWPITGTHGAVLCAVLCSSVDQ